MRNFPFDKITRVCNAMNHSNRWDAVLFLEGYVERKSGEVAEELNITNSLACYHLDILVDSGIVYKIKRPGAGIYYKLNTSLLRALHSANKFFTVDNAENHE